MFRQLFLLAIVLFAFSLATLPAIAQETPSNECLQEELVSEISAIVTRLEASASDFWDVYSELQKYLADQRQACLGLTFSGEPETGRPSVVIGPVDIPDGIYRVTLKTDGRLTVEIEEFSGQCEYIGFVVREGEASAGAEDVFEAEGCRALITVEHIDTPWSLVFEPLR